MPAPELPRLRSTITGHLDSKDERFVWLYDSGRISQQMVRVRREVLTLLELFTGGHSIRDMQVALMRRSGDQLVPSDVLQDLVNKFDEALFLEGPRLQARFDEFLRSPVREPACIGSYEEEPALLRKQLEELFIGDKGPGVPTPPLSPPYQGGDKGGVNGLCGVLIPHIDFHRGGPTFAWGFKELVERSEATVFVIMGTSHYGRRRFTLTRKNFRTPLGLVETDQGYVNRLAACYSEGAFDDEIAHLPEHSIEFQVVFLQYCLGRRRPFRIVPILVGSFQDCIHAEVPPREQADVRLMIQALRRAEAESKEKVCYIASGDLAHIGPKFGDPAPVDVPQLDWSRRQDHALLEQAAAVDLDGFFRVILNEKDQRRMCGFPPTYTLMAALQPERGRLLHYDQYVDPNGFESVSFASLAFYKP